MNLIKRCQIVRPISKRRFTALVKAIRDQHPWLAGFKCEPSPGHLALVAEFLVEMETILSSDALYSLCFLHIRTYQGRISVRLRLAMPMPAEEAALVDAINGLEAAGFNTCAVCGQPFLTKNRTLAAGFCSLHPHTWAFFTEELADLRPHVADTPNENAADVESSDPQDIDEKSHCDQRGNYEMQKLPADTLKNAERALPCIAFLDANKLQAIRDNRQSKSKEQAHRLDSMVERIISAGSDTRQLAVLPNSWPNLIDVFEAAHPNFSALAELLRDHFALASLGDHRIQLPPILLVGEPGVGKTAAANFIAKLLNLPFKVIDMASAQTNSILAGSESFWSNSQEGAVFELLAYQQLANPIILLDEIDKVVENDRFNPIGALYQLLEPTSACTFQDLSVRELRIDASHINWIGSANSLDHIPLPILSRMTVLNIPAPTRQQIQIIAANLYQQIRLAEPWGTRFTDCLSCHVLDYLSVQTPRELSLRLKRALGIAARAGRSDILIEDIQAVETIPTKVPMGFLGSIVKSTSQQGASHGEL